MSTRIYLFLAERWPLGLRCAIDIVFAVRCYESAAYAVVRCLSVRPSVTFVNAVKTNKYIFNFFTIG